MAMMPLYNPKNPVMADIGEMTIGKSIYVVGKPRKFAVKFAINLYCGADYTKDKIALHINVRYPQKQVVCNSWGPEGWAKQEDKSGFPFKKEEVFAIRITCQQSGFQISAYGKDYAFFKHRLPYKSVTHVNVEQDCDIILVTTDDESPRSEEMIRQIPCGKRQITIRGQPSTMDRFDIDLLDSDKKTIFLRISVRMLVGQIVRNTLINGDWWTEERSLGMAFPFRQGVPFELEISVYSRNLVVKINGEYAFEYENTWGGADSIRHLRIQNYVAVESIDFD